MKIKYVEGYHLFFSFRPLTQLREKVFTENLYLFNVFLTLATSLWDLEQVTGLLGVPCSALHNGDHDKVYPQASRRALDEVRLFGASCAAELRGNPRNLHPRIPF